MTVLTYSDYEIRKDEDGFDIKYVYVPALEEWMTEEQFYFQKACYDGAMADAYVVEMEHGSNDIIEDDGSYDYEDIDEEMDSDIDYSSMTREEAIEDFNRTGVNHSKYDLNDWDEINRRLGYEFFKPKK